jgi:tRNA U34 2-thiouridine synthase MnmA/TrmU
MYYTIGQRRGLNLGGEKERTFVIKKDLDNNILYVASGDENKYLYSTSAIIEDFNFLTEERIKECSCKYFAESHNPYNHFHINLCKHWLKMGKPQCALFGKSKDGKIVVLCQGFVRNKKS